MSTPHQVESEVVRVLRTYCDVGERSVSRDDRLQEDLGLDSAQLLSLALEVENSFQIQLEESQEDPPRTIGDVVDLITLRLAELDADA